jgi:hypothetical protein
MTTGQGSAARLAWHRRPHRASTYFLLIVLVFSTGGVLYLWQRAEQTRIVCVAAAGLPAYHQITRTDIRETVVRSNQVPSHATADPGTLIGRYTLTAIQHGQPFDLGALGPRLPAGALTGQLVVGLPASISDVDGGQITRGDRVDILLASTTAMSPRDGVLPGAVVLDLKRDTHTGEYVLVCAFAAKYESVLLTTGGTARIFVALVPPRS